MLPIKPLTQEALAKQAGWESWDKWVLGTTRILN
jgi:hypothetical protein